MPGGSSPLLGNNAFGQTIYQSITPAASVTAATSTTSTYTIKGVKAGQLVFVEPQAAIQALLSIGSCWVSANDTLSIQWINASASNSSASPTALTCAILVIQPELIWAGVTSYPSGVE
jgi:hypothetical protein